MRKTAKLAKKGDFLGLGAPNALPLVVIPALRDIMTLAISQRVALLSLARQARSRTALVLICSARIVARTSFLPTQGPTHAQNVA